MITILSNLAPAWLDEATSGEIAAVDAATLYELQQELAEAKATIEARQKILRAGLATKFHDQIAEARAAKASLFGKVSVDAGDGFTIESDAKKSIYWDQAVMRAGIDQLRSWNEDPDDYVTTTHAIGERAWNAWPAGIRRLFDKGRTERVQGTSWLLKAAS